MAPRRESSSRPADRARHRHGGESSKRNQHRKRKTHTRTPTDEGSRGEGSSSQGLSAAALAQLNRQNARRPPKTKPRERGEGRNPNPPPTPKSRKPRAVTQQAKADKKTKKRRVVSGALMEEGRIGRGRKPAAGGWSDGSLEKEDLLRRPRKKLSRKKLWILLGCCGVIVLVVVVAVAVVVSKKKSGDGAAVSNLEGKERGSIPARWQNTYLDPWAWHTTKDFNVTFTDATVGGLPVMGLLTDWDDSNRANDKVPPLQDKWGSYGDRPARGVNLGGWLTLEPFITPSLFDYDARLGIIDEYTLCKHLGSAAAGTLEAHYDSFVDEDTFRAIAAAGLDHVRIPFSHWAVENYDNDPYVFRTSWRYLLRGIEWARKYGLRVNLDLHSLPGSQNGWNHSGRFGAIGWLNGTQGQANARRALEVHDRLSKFFAQPRYRNIITHYGLVNEPRMTLLRVSDVVSWTTQAYKLVRANGVRALVVFGDGFMGLDKWQGLLPGSDLVLDVHQYVIFNENQIDFSHRKKVQYACDGWTQQAELSMDPARGHGPTIFAEWSQADTDCAKHLTGVGWGNRWEGTYDTGDEATSTLKPRCPAKDASCSCANANQDPARFSAAYSSFLRFFAEAQMHSFEKGWGWWYWTWKTESAPLWSYEAGLAAGLLPAKAYEPAFKCDADVPDFAKDGLSETY